MKYGVCTSIDNYYILSELGFDYIELSGNVISKLSEEEFNKVKNIIEKGKVKCCGFNASLPPEIVLCGEGFDINKAREYAQILCKRGSELNIFALGIGSPKSRRFVQGDSIEKAWQQVEEFMSMFAEVAAPYNIVVMYESLNHTETQFGLKIREGVELVKKLNKENLKIVYDIYHMHMEKEDFKELENALPYIYHVHIAERVGEERRYPSDALYDYYMQVIKILKDYGYDRAICTEAFDGDVKEGAMRTLKLLN